MLDAPGDDERHEQEASDWNDGRGNPFVMPAGGCGLYDHQRSPAERHGLDGAGDDATLIRIGGLARDRAQAHV